MRLRLDPTAPMGISLAPEVKESSQRPIVGSWGRVDSVVAGTNVTVDNSDPKNPVVSTAGGASNWGDLGGTLSDQTDLQTALDAKVTQEDTFLFKEDDNASGLQLRMKGTALDKNVAILFLDESEDLSTYFGNGLARIEYDPLDGWFFGAHSLVLSANETVNTTAKAVLMSANNGMAIGTDGTNGRVFIGNPGYSNIYAYLKTDNLTVDRTFQFPDQGGTIATQVGDDDIEITDSTKGVILKSPDGTRYRITVSNGGTLTVTAA
jgi:hypothetical protein